jgi:hypothetical protein
LWEITDFITTSELSNNTMAPPFQNALRSTFFSVSTQYEHSDQQVSIYLLLNRASETDILDLEFPERRKAPPPQGPSHASAPPNAVFEVSVTSPEISKDEIPPAHPFKPVRALNT